MAENPQDAWSGVYCTRDYNPYKFQGSKNPNFGSLDGRLLDFKEGKSPAVRAEIQEFLAALKDLKLPKGTLIAIVPGHAAAASNAGKPLARVAKVIAAMDSRFVAEFDALIRKKTIPKLSKGGGRSVETHIASMGVQKPANLKGKTVVVLDDTVTSEGSLTAARKLLEEAGAKVAAIGLGRTVKYL